MAQSFPILSFQPKPIPIESQVGNTPRNFEEASNFKIKFLLRGPLRRAEGQNFGPTGWGGANRTSIDGLGKAMPW